MPAARGVGIGYVPNPTPTILGQSTATPAAAVGETVPLWLCAVDVAVISTGRLHLARVYLQAGKTVTTMTWFSGATPGAAMTHQLFVLYDSARALLAQSADDTSAAWSANTMKSLNMVTPYPVTTSGYYYMGLWVNGTVPSLRGYTTVSAVSTIVPLQSGFSDSSLVATPPNPASALTAQTTMPYGYVS